MSISANAQNSDAEAITANSIRRVKPFLKWPGGKRWLLQRHSQLFRNATERYVEPFLGGGAVYLHLQPARALLSDINPDVIAVYAAIRTSWRAIVRQLQVHQIHHSNAYYYNIRDEDPKDPVERAARILYLNRTCFNGIYRVNLQGKFNVPMGTKTRVILPDDDFEAVARLLQSTALNHCDFEETLCQCKKGDFVFADPPYTVRHNNNGFIKYNETLFLWSDQQRLAKALKVAYLRGADVLCTNADHASVRGLYDPAFFEMSVVSRYSSISASPESRKHFNELIIRSRRDQP